jgi:hypothetical protein
MNYEAASKGPNKKKRSCRKLRFFYSISVNLATNCKNLVTLILIKEAIFVSMRKFIRTTNKNKMKTKLLSTIAVSILLLLPAIISAQAPTLGTAANFVLFSSNGAVSNTGISQLTGNVGTNSGSSTAFGNVNGVMHDNDSVSAQCATDLLVAYNQLNGATATLFPAPLLGNGDTLIAGIYSIAGATTLDSDLFLDANGNANAVFIFKIQGSFSTNASSKIKLINGAKACNVFWKVEGLVSMASGTTMRGTIIANNAAINMNTNDTLEGRALSTTGSVTVAGVLAYTPVGCGSPLLSGPVAPALGTTACYSLFSSNGSVTNSGVTYLTGDVGTNVGLTTGFNAQYVTGTIHPIPDGSTAACATDLLAVSNYLNTLPYDIELLYPAQFGNNLVLTPHTYVMNAATVFTDTLYLNAAGNTSAVFVIQINGALSTSTYANVVLINGAQAKNVYWEVNGAVDINDYTRFRGTIICNNGAINLNTGAILDGSALTTSGNLNASAITAVIPTSCITTGLITENEKEVISVYPNPFSTSLTIKSDYISQVNPAELRIYSVLGKEVMNTHITKQLSTCETSELSPGIYFYKIVCNNIVIQSGKLLAQAK